MFLSFALIAFIASGGFALTYLLTREVTVLWRVAAGNILGSAVFGTALFLITLVGGLTAATAALALVISMLPIVLLRTPEIKAALKKERIKAREKLQGKSMRRLLPAVYYVLFALVFVFFFERAMIETSQGIFTGGSNNLGDLPFHLGAIFSFTDGNNFPPQNPSFAGARFSYPFIADLITAAFMKFGIGVKDAMLAQNVSWALSLLIVLQRFVFDLTKSRLASRVGPALLFFSGGLGFYRFFADYWGQSKSLWQFIWALPVDYTTFNNLGWGNSMITLFITQRSLLLGMPLTVIVLGILWKIFNTEPRDRTEESDLGDAKRRSTKDRSFLSRIEPFVPFFAGLAAGMLPLVHLHSLFVLFIIGVFLFFLKLGNWREWLMFAGGVAIIAVPELIWSTAGSASDSSKFFEWHFGWTKGDRNFLWFWFLNTGIFIPLIVFGAYISSRIGRNRTNDDAEESQKSRSKKPEKLGTEPEPLSDSLALFYLPFAFLFVLVNVAKLAPWEWDNIKVLVYWFIGSIPFAAFAIAWLWSRGRVLKAVAVACFFVLTFSGILDVWRTVSAQINNRVFDADAVKIAEMIRTRTFPDALFLNAPTYNSPVVLTGRQSLMRYPGHLGSHGIDYASREADVKAIYSGGPAAVDLMKEYGVEYVLISPEERNSLRVNEAFFAKYPMIAEAGAYKFYKIED